MKLINVVFLFPLFLLTGYSTFCQQQRHPLREILHSIEQQHNVSFAFTDESIRGVFIESPPEDNNLQKTLIYLNQKTGLIFTQLDQRFITINKPSEVFIRACATLIDDETQEKIVGAVIQADTKIAVSNTDGFFEFKDIHENTIIQIKTIGYQKMEILANSLRDSICKTIRLKIHTTYLTEVIINNYLTTGIRKTAEGSLSIETKELGLLPGLTEPDVLFTAQALPGIQSIDETISNINVRGGTHDQNLVLWDGMKMYQQGHFFGLISAFNPYLTKEVTLIKNGTSALLGDGVSSTIDIHSDDQVANTFEGSAGINMINADFFTKIPLSKKTSFHLAARRSIADIFQTPTYQKYYDRAFKDTDVTNATDTVSSGKQFRFYDLSANLLYDLTLRDKIRINFLRIQNTIRYNESGSINGATQWKQSSLSQQSIVSGISYSRLWSPKINTNAQLYLSKYNLDAINHDISNNQRLAQDNEVLDIGLKLDTRINLSSRLDILSGYQFYEVGVSNLDEINNPSFYRLKKTVLQTHCLFAESDFNSLSTKTNIRAGLRANYFGKINKTILEPRLSFNQKLNENISVELLGEMKSQTTTQVIEFQNDFLGVEKRRWVQANDKDIPILRSKQLSIGVQLYKKNFLITIEGYAKWVDDIITSSQGFENQFQYVRSIGNYNTKGIDFLINQRISKFNTWGSYSLAKSDFSFKDLVPPNFPNNLDIRHRATGGISYQSMHFEISTGINWHTGKPYTQPKAANNIVDGSIQYQDPNTYRLKNYWRMDLSARYKFAISKKAQGTIGLSVWNIFNRNNIIDAYYQLNYSKNITLNERNALGLVPNVMIRVDF